MTQALRPYPQYRPSGISWLGNIPAHWQTAQLKRGYTVQLGKMLTPEPNSKDDTLEPYLRSANIQWSGAVITDVKEMWFSPYEKSQYAILKGDLLVSEGGDVGRSAIWNDELPACYIQNAINRIRSKTNHSTRFLYYWMYTIKHCGYVDEICEKATIRHFTAEKVARVPIPIPPFEEQKSISAFLDIETSKIDRLTEKTRQHIARLQERRSALISAAVTGKIDVRSSEK